MDDVIHALETVIASLDTCNIAMFYLPNINYTRDLGIPIKWVTLLLDVTSCSTIKNGIINMSIVGEY